MDMAGAREPVTEPSHLLKVRRLRDRTRDEEVGLGIGGHHPGERCEEPECIFLQGVSRQRDKKELAADPQPGADLGPIPERYVLVVDAIRDCSDAISRVARVCSQILPFYKLADSNKTSNLPAPNLLGYPRLFIKKTAGGM